MEIQNLLVGALTYLVKYQATQCPAARSRALMMFDALAKQKNIDANIQSLCNEANEFLTT